MTTDDFRRDLVEGAQNLGLSLDERAVDCLRAHQELLKRWARRINLTGLDSDRDMAGLLYLDSAVLAVRCQGDVLDVGTGAGFPGMVIKILRPELEVTLLEARHKRVAFLRQAARELGVLPAIEWGRVEDLEGHFAEVVARAVFPPGEWIEKGARLVRSGGRLWVLVGEELPSLVCPPGFEVEPPIPYSLPFGHQKRHLMAFRKA